LTVPIRQRVEVAEIELAASRFSDRWSADVFASLMVRDGKIVRAS
jgi:hypothetical protein